MFTQFVHICHAVALTLLERKAATGQLTPSILSLPLRDLAFDCIADLFTLNEEKIPVQIQVYFECVDLESISEEETLSYLRRLVFSKVRNGLFRTYNEMDPTLGKILRNIKLGASLAGEFVEGDRFGDTVLSATGCDPLFGKPLLDRESLFRILSRIHRPDSRIPSMLSALSSHIREQSDYCRVVPLVPLGLALRDFLSSSRIHPDEPETHIDLDLDSGTFQRIVEEACSSVERQMRRKYTVSGGIDEALYKSYFDVIAATLISEACETEMEGSLFHRLQTRYPDLNEEEYRSNHRNTVEYLMKLVRKRARLSLEHAFG
ncbi:MAG: hypothetical protein WB699_10980 [Bacteroidota bacterium]